MDTTPGATAFIGFKLSPQRAMTIGLPARSVEA